MPVRDVLVQVARSYLSATSQPMAGHPVAALVRHELAGELRDLLRPDNADLIVKASPGNGNWAAVPWAAIFDSVVTESATMGFYPVYLFDVAGSRIYLSLNQGTTTVRSEFRAEAPAVLAKRADLMRQRIAEFRGRLPVEAIELGDGRLGQDYAAGHALGVAYDAHNLPGEDRLAEDLETVVRSYRALIYRGGLDFDAGGQPSDDTASVDEQRQYRMHRRIERNSRAARLARAQHGYACQACNMKFEERYGLLGEGFIEVHHLRPISSLNEGEKVVYNVAKDFAVLCANCHRMIHRLEDPSDLASLRDAIRTRRRVVP